MPDSSKETEEILKESPEEDTADSLGEGEVAGSDQEPDTETLSEDELFGDADDDVEVPLNVDPDPDNVEDSLENAPEAETEAVAESETEDEAVMAEDGQDTHVEDADSGDSGDNEDGSALDEAGEAGESDSSRENATEDKIGIEMGDDELWDDDEMEEISLFEEEVLNELKKEEEEQEQDSVAASDSDGSMDEGVSDKTEGSGVGVEDSAPESSGDGKSVKDGNDESGTGESEGEASSPSSFVSSVLPWSITFISTVLLGLGIFILMQLWQSGSVSSSLEGRNPSTFPQNVAPSTSEGMQRHGQSLEHSPVAETIELAPFIIPGNSGGELVFFKLKVEVVVPDISSKQALLRKQAWVRDIIYQELKGLDISQGIKADVLQRFRMPLIQKLNKELAPIRIDDLRLMGYILR